MPKHHCSLFRWAREFPDTSPKPRLKQSITLFRPIMVLPVRRSFVSLGDGSALPLMRFGRDSEGTLLRFDCSEGQTFLKIDREKG